MVTVVEDVGNMYGCTIAHVIYATEASGERVLGARCQPHRAEVAWMGDAGS
jgi:hypothetical protein